MDSIADLTPKQINYLQNSNRRINIADGSVRSGKTVAANLRWMEYVVNSGPPGDYLMFGKTERTLKRNILSPMKSLLGNSFRINQGQGEVTLCDKKIYLCGASDERAADKIRGATLAGAYGDEISLAPESFVKMLLSRLSIKDAKLFGTTNPEGPYHWLKTSFIDRINDLDMSLHHFKIEDNTFLDPKYVESLKKEYTGVFYKRYIEGLWVMAEGIIYDVFDENKHVDKIVEPDTFQNYIVSCDYGTNNPCTFGLYGFDGQSPPAYLIKEYYYDSNAKNKRQKTDRQYANDMVKFIGDIPVNTIYVDPSALSFIVELKQLGKWTVKAAKNDVLDGIRFVSKLLSTGGYYVDESCLETIKGYQSYCWDPKAQERGEDKPLKINDHTADRDRYALFSHFYKKFYRTGQKYYK